jgi:glycosyltransferase involved in cell wall biosynthesis
MDRATAMEKTGQAEPKLRILHVLRAPVGGLFRHVLDLTEEQIARGHDVGLVTDSTTGGDKAAELLNRLAPSLALGLARIPMSRQPSPLDLATIVKIARYARSLELNVIHGHGAKGGVYARFPGLWSGSPTAIRAYTPHGGSFSITMPYKLQRFYMFVERLFEPFTDAYLFESSFVAGRFAEYVGKTHAVTKIIPNGISAAEFAPVEPLPDAADLLYVGELRRQKGIELLIDAMVELTSIHGKTLRLLLVGNGPDKEKFVARAAALGLEGQVTFMDAMPAREAFKHGRILVLPSRGESLPYIILEAAGAQLPIVATNVGDIGNILSPHGDRLVPPNDLGRLVAAMQDMLKKTPVDRQRETADLAALVAERFTVTNMVDSVLAVYREAIERKSSRQANSKPSFALLS